MNFLAHLYLADDADADAAGSMIGNLLPDFVRGWAKLPLDPVVRRGAERHRYIDAFVETHSAFSRSRARLRAAGHGLFAGILVDVCYDHVLAVDWPRHHAEPLPDFVDRAYAAMLAAEHRMPPPMPSIVRRMAEQDWLGSYATLAGLEARLAQMSRRFDQRFGRTFDPAAAVADLAADLTAERPGLRDDFDLLWADLRRTLTPTCPSPAHPAAPAARRPAGSRPSAPSTPPAAPPDRS